MALTHIDGRGKARMVDVTAKDVTERVAMAKGRVLMKRETLDLVLANEMKKGDVLGVARVAGIMAAKRTGELIPLCHPLNVTSVEVEFEPVMDPPGIDITATARVASRTGVEMEALTAVSVAALTIYDMCKAADKGMELTDIRLVRKTGGKSGDYMREGEP
ncbi:MAG: cyclic pyranopterin monophosphate synthase MoaC [Deltaproteobacteria bacterium]|nr:cyclic pyranopterin monophosphate synthase MoaC [Deltaproteobacteria bacterium]MBZ0219447.1 cyclic pyranopterin monophosphate synthase MoaC [Deltaproteobacteria bacterium]